MTAESDEPTPAPEASTGKRPPQPTHRELKLARLERALRENLKRRKNRTPPGSQPPETGEDRD